MNTTNSQMRGRKREKQENRSRRAKEMERQITLGEVVNTGKILYEKGQHNRKSKKLTFERYDG